MSEPHVLHVPAIPPVPGPPSVVLVVDDNAPTRLAVRQVLEDDGHQVVEATTGEEAIEACARLQPDLVLLDLVMPGIGGVETLRRLRALPDGAHTPVLVITALDDPQSVQEAFGAGAIDYVTKPIYWPVLRRRVARLIEAHRDARRLRLLESAVHNATDAVIVTTADLDLPGPAIVYVNPSFTRMTGFEAAEVLGRSPRILQGPRTDRATLDRLRRSLKGGEAFSGEIVNYRKDGSEYPIEWHVAPIRNAEGRTTHWVSIQRDITEREQTEEARRQSQKLESLGLLAGGVAHDFNNLLTGMLAQATVALGRLAADSPARPHIEKVVVAAERAADLTRGLLAYAGRASPEVEPVDLNRILQDNADLLAGSLPPEVEVALHLEPSLPPIDADRGQVQQVAMNLIINAAQAIEGEAGRVGIATRSRVLDARTQMASVLGTVELPPGPYVSLEVTDTGTGIDPDTIARIFDPFFTTKHRGRGLGLSLTMGIIRAHGGVLEVESDPGRGTTFRVTFPASRAELGEPPGASPARAAAKGWVLVIDDEEPVREAAQDVLELAGLSVVTARGAREGLECLARYGEKIGVVLLDMHMPEMDGEEAFHAIRAARPGVKIILSSGYDEAEATRRLSDAGLDAFLQKPYSAERLIARVQAVLDRPAR